MATLTVTAKGQITFRKELLKHLGIQPGDKVEVDLLPEGRASLHAARPTGDISRLIGCLAGKTTKVATLEEIQKAIEKGWAGEL